MTQETTQTVVVVPCYNEAQRFVAAPLLLAARNSTLRFILVDDGSRDGTLDVLKRTAADCPHQISVLALPDNAGKAEAVRRGLLEAITQGAQIIGYLDGDGATPVDAIVALQETLTARDAQVALGSRVMLLGHAIQRSAWRHYFGRVLATVAASFTLRIPVYDTQCGAKLFRVSPTLQAALAVPFLSRWVFDVELLGRLLYSTTAPPLTLAQIVEMPLRQWSDVPGSKVRLADGLRALLDLIRLGLLFRKKY